MLIKVPERGSDHFEASYFERMAALEHQHPWTAAMRQLALGWLRKFGWRGGDLLDAGCGSGGFLAQCAAQGASRLYGIDPFPAALAEARRRSAAQLAVGSVVDLPYRSSIFQAVHCADVLQHLDARTVDHALAEMERVLLPGGLLVLRVRGPRILHALDRCFRAGQLGRDLSRRGFQVLRVTPVNFLPSLLAERHAPDQVDPQRVGGIELRDPSNQRSRLLGAYLQFEVAALLASPLRLPFGHTVMAVARKPPSG